MIAALILLLFIGAAACEEIDPSQWLERTGIESLLDESEALGGIEVRAIVDRALAGELIVDANAIGDALRRLLNAVKDGMLGTLSTLAAPVLTCLLMKAVSGKNSGGAMTLVCRTSCAAVLMGRFVEAKEIAEAALHASVKMVNAASPVLVAVAAMAGDGARSALMTPMAALCAGMIDSVLLQVSLPLCGVAAAVAAAANLSERFQLNRLFGLLNRVVSRGVRLLLALSAGLLALQGLLAGGQDIAAARVVRRVIQSALPVIGGEVADASPALLASASAIRSAVGAAGMLAIIGACAVPVARLIVESLSLRLASAILEPVADRGVANIVGHFAEAAQMLAALCTGGAMLGMMTLGGCLAFIGS